LIITSLALFSYNWNQREDPKEWVRVFFATEFTEFSEKNAQKLCDLPQHQPAGAVCD
jgi:hypothetical protein